MDSAIGCRFLGQVVPRLYLKISVTIFLTYISISLFLFVHYLPNANSVLNLQLAWLKERKGWNWDRESSERTGFSSNVSVFCWFNSFLFPASKSTQSHSRPHLSQGPHSHITSSIRVKSVNWRCRSRVWVSMVIMRLKQKRRLNVKQKHWNMCVTFLWPTTPSQHSGPFYSLSPFLLGSFFLTPTTSACHLSPVAAHFFLSPECPENYVHFGQRPHDIPLPHILTSQGSLKATSTTWTEHISHRSPQLFTQR